ncbi:hypothetical protein CEP54_008831 [Fusarium duplospermum]|uniref:Protein kinase domain-containing protein n=1 Tax=Fusarium duplospermum TaxID=1325734 RepID=A0A428PU19_9HYPO|nr:hypothetical protein CEP54_008831 [Fusarium duplospermum]
MVWKELSSKLRPNDHDRPDNSDRQNNDDADPPPQFLPRSDLESTFCKEFVGEIIANALQMSDTEVIEIRDKICGNGSEPRRIKILATLVLMEEVKYIRDFLDQDVCDDKLPLSLRSMKAHFRKWGDGHVKNWKHSHIESFCERQYAVLAPVFNFSTVKHHKFKPKHRMPFLERLESKGRGAHGMISRVRIHPDHQRWDPDSPPKYDTCFFAVKEFRNRADFDKEKAALRRFSCPRKGHKHLIPLLLSYQLSGKCFMVFPWAQGNLAEFWKNNPSNAASRDDSYWFIRQCEGLASGLSKVHKHDSWLLRQSSVGDASQADSRNRGRHGDIKPENILWFEQAGASRGHLVVADFTLMRFHSKDTVNYTEAREVGFSPTYCPPEVDEGSQISVSQRYDIWTLGCVYLEFITWYLIGYDAIRGDFFKTPAGKRLESFTILRSKTDKKHGMPTNRFFTPNDGPGAKVKDSVMKWIRMLHGNQHCSQAMHDFLDLVENHMLVPTPSGRWPMDKVCAELGEILRGCKDNDRYCHRGDPRRNSDDDNFPPEFDDERSKEYAIFQKPTYSTSTSSLDGQSNPDLDILEEAFGNPGQWTLVYIEGPANRGSQTRSRSTSFTT